ncbi:MAG: hypothetical protein ACT4OI_00730 [Methanobacteriota archaeon]
MRIARPKEPEAAFKRRRSPPPQATKFLFWSVVTSVVFLGLLAVVFIPRGFEHGSPCASTVLELTFGEAGELRVNATAFVLDRSAFYASLTRDGVVVARLDPGLSNGSALLAFVDNDTDGRVGVGDYFVLDTSTSSSYRFDVFLVCNDGRVGVAAWTGRPS